ncbi:MAG: hypothetical protein QGI05_01060 [Candidatus Omnitrophota bacterium]|nr:hypothetical protein [Candidatus Omnitrophota bacterium]
MKIITVSGAHSGVGKTHAIGELLNELKDWSVLKVTVSRNGLCKKANSCGVCNRLRKRFAIVTDDKIISQEGKDTSSFKAKGAKEVIWLQAKPHGLKEGLKKSLAKFKDPKGIIIEGTSVLRYIKPSFAIFILGKVKKLRPAARLAHRKADIVYGFSR